MLHGLQRMLESMGLLRIITSRINYAYEFLMHVLRICFINLLVLGVGVLLIIGGLIMVPLALISYAPWDIGTKVSVLFLFGFGYLVLGVGLSIWMFQKKRWEDAFRCSPSGRAQF